MNTAVLQSLRPATQGVPLEQLAANPHVDERTKIAEGCRQFEAVLVRQLLSEARKPIIRSDFAGESAISGIYNDLINNVLADSISHSGMLGLATGLESQLSRQLGQAITDSPEAEEAEPSDPEPRPL